jgi:regulator of protease activity HflC (stomatin/prohibitin superfamily)
MQLALLWIVGTATVVSAWMHMVETGHVGIYDRFRALQDGVLPEGLHFHWPIVTRIHDVQVSVQTDVVKTVTCGTRSGVRITFGEIRVVNVLNVSAVIPIVRRYGLDYDQELIFRRVEHELCQICSHHTLDEVYIGVFDKIDDLLRAELQAYIELHAPGLQIHAVRVTRPTIPPEVDAEYGRVAQEQTRRLANEQQLANEMQVLRAKHMRENATIVHTHEQHMTRLQAELVQAKQQQEIARVEAETARVRADSTLYQKQKEAEAMLLLLSNRGYVEVETARSLAQNQKIYYGDRLPQHVMMLPTATKLD